MPNQDHFIDTGPPPSPPHSGKLREAQEVFIHMHRNFRVSRNIRAHWFFKHINRTVCIEDTPTDDEYSQEMKVVGIIPKCSSPDEVVVGERFLVSLDTQVTYISRYYRHVFVLDLSPSTIVADSESNCCLHTKLLECLRLSMTSVTKSFTIPGTTTLFSPQIYVSVVVFIPFLGFEDDLVLVHGELLTESNTAEVLENVTEKFNSLLKSLYTFSKPILKKWGMLRRRHRNKYDSSCDNNESETAENLNSYRFVGDSLSSNGPRIPMFTLNDSTNSIYRPRPKLKRIGEEVRPIDFDKKIWAIENESSTLQADAKCDGYIFPEWALIFMLRLGLICVQTLPENTQSNVIVITDAVAGMPDAEALQELLNQIRSYTVSCSFIQIQGKNRSESCFGHVSSCELFHFLAMATFGAYIPNCRCSTGVDLNGSETIRPLNPFHRALICWCFQNALQDNVHINNLVMQISPGFAEIYKSGPIRHRAFNRTYTSTLHEILYVRLREGFTLKSVEILYDANRINIHLSMPFRPLIFIEYVINAPWPENNRQRESICVELVVQSPYNEIKDLMTQKGGNITGADPARVKLLTTLKKTLENIQYADNLLLHIHSFNSNPAYYEVPEGADDFAIHHTEDGYDLPKASFLEPALWNPDYRDDFKKFSDFWSVLCGMDEGLWQKWVHMHFERVILRSEQITSEVFSDPTQFIDCDEAMKVLQKLLRKRSSFCLIHNELYVTFVMKRRVHVPSYFYMTRVSHEPPYLIIKTAFLGGISSVERRRVVDEFRSQLKELKIEGTEEAALWVYRRPLERILVCYHELPTDLRTIVRICENERGDVRDLTLHNAVSKYLESRRRLWSLQVMLPVSEDYRVPDSERHHRLALENILFTLLLRRFEEGFKVAWCNDGIVGLCRQVYVQSSGPALEQYILFPPAAAQLPYYHERKKMQGIMKSDGRQMRDRGDGFLLVTEYWKEPCAICESATIQGPTDDGDDEVVSLLYTVDQLIRMCEFPTPPGSLSVKLEVTPSPYADDRNIMSPDDLTPLSGRVNIFQQPFDLSRLLMKSNRVLAMVPLFSNDSPEKPERLPIFVTNLHKQLALMYSVSFVVEDTKFYINALRGMQSDISEHLTDDVISCFDGPSRVYVCKRSHWVVSLIIVPTCSALPPNNVLPLIVASCDEAQMAYGLVHRKPFGRVGHCRLTIGHGIAEGYTEPGYLRVPRSSVPTYRFCGSPDVAAGYGPIKLGRVIEEMFRSAIERTHVTTMYACVQLGLPIDATEGTAVVELSCDYATREVEAVSRALDTFCCHLHKEPNDNEPLIHCTTGSSLEKLLIEVTNKSFRSIPNQPSTFFFSHAKDERDKGSQLMAKVFPSYAKDVFDSVAGPGGGRRDSAMGDYKNTGGDRSPEEEIMNSSAKTSNEMTPSDLMRLNQVLSDGQGSLRKPKKTDPNPLFISFNVSVQYPDGSVESFNVGFLPSCVHQVLEMSQIHKAPYTFDVRKVRMSLVVYMMTWPPVYCPEVEPESPSSSDEEAPVSRRTDVFLAKLPNKERGAINQMIARMSSLLELESVLMDSRQNRITVEKLKKISQFISKECADGSAVDRMDERTRVLSLVIQEPDALERLKDRLNGLMIDYCMLRRAETTNMYYCCQVEDRVAYHAALAKAEHGLMKARKNSAQSLPASKSPGESPGTIMARSRTTGGSSASNPRHFSVDVPNTPAFTIGGPAQVGAHRATSCDVPIIQVDGVGRNNDEVVSTTDNNDDLCDFWVIITLDSNITMQFCQRYGSKHRRISDLAWRKCRQIIRTINQELLLDLMFDKRECDPLLMTSLPPSADAKDDTFEQFELLSSGSSEEEDKDKRTCDRTITDDARFTFAPGSFACPVQKQHWFHIHPRLRKSGPQPLVTACELLRLTLVDQFAVKNMPNTYVVKESDGNVMYMQLHISVDTFKTTLKNNKLHIKETNLVEVERKMKSSVLLVMYGVEPPGRDIAELLVDRLQKRLDQATLEQLIRLLAKNNRAVLMPADVQFIQGDPARPSRVFNFSVPFDLSGFLSAVNFYAKQHLQVHMQPARCKGMEPDENHKGPPPLILPGSSPAMFTPPAGVFLPYNDGSNKNKTTNYGDRNFYLYVRSPQIGIRTTGIACLELRFVDTAGAPAKMTEGVLRRQTHNMLVKFTADKQSRMNSYREITHTYSEDEPHPQKGVCAYAQVIVWQAGDVGLKELETVLTRVIEQAHCDVVTEYGVLNLAMFENNSAAVPPVVAGTLHLPPNPQSPLPTTASPQNRSAIAAAKASPLPVDRRQLLKKRDSSEALLGQPGGNGQPGTPALLAEPTTTKKSNSVFSFDQRRGSIASDLGSVADNLNPTPRVPTHVNSRFVTTAADWFEYVVGRDESDQNSVTKIEWKFDCPFTLRKALVEICDRLEDGLRSDYTPLSDTVSLCEFIGKTGFNRYEVIPTHKVAALERDIGVNPVEAQHAEFLVIAMCNELAKDSLRYGYEKTQSEPPDILRILESAAAHSPTPGKETFVPCLLPSFVPRQRILYATAHQDLLTVYLYNFHSTRIRDIRVIINRTTLWHNARARLLREIGLHKLGITHLSPLLPSSDNPYLCLVWRNPSVLLDCDYPPDNLEMTTMDATPAYFASRLFRPYRGLDLAFLHMNRLPCLTVNQWEQLRLLRDEMLANLNRTRTYTTIHEQLQSGDGDITEADMESLMAASRRVHFVQTPVLLFPKWRRRIGEVRGTVVPPAEESDARRISTPTGSQSQPSVTQGPINRGRANTLSVPNTSSAPPDTAAKPQPLRFRSEDDDPFQVKILYMLLNDYVKYLTTLGMKIFNVSQLDKDSVTHHLYSVDYPQGCRYTPKVAMYKVVSGGIVLVRLSFSQPYFILSVRVWSMYEMLKFREPEHVNKAKTLLRDLEETKDVFISKCHIHSFTYDFHLRMLSKYLVGKDEVLFNPGYNTSSFLIDFLKYYGCRPPNARNCVYEERPTYQLKHGVQDSQIWTHFLEIHYEKVYGWKVIKIKNTDDDDEVSDNNKRTHEYMLVSSDLKHSDGRDHETLRLLLRDRRKDRNKKSHLNLVQYLFLIDKDQSGPMVDEDPPTEAARDNKQPGGGEFRNVQRPSEEENLAEIEKLMKQVEQGRFPTVDGSIHSAPPSTRMSLTRQRSISGGIENSSPPKRVRSSGQLSDGESISGSPLCESKGTESDGGLVESNRPSVQGSASRRHRRHEDDSDECRIPGENVTYVTFMSKGQRLLQQLLEDHVLVYNENLASAVADAEFQCRRDQMWDSVLQLPKRRKQQSTMGLVSTSRFLPSDNGPWGALRSSYQEARTADLETLITLVTVVKMEDREPRLRAMLLGTNSARLCRFLYAKYNADRCRFFESPTKRFLLITNPNNMDSFFVVTCEHETSPSLSMLFKETDLLNEEMAEPMRFRQSHLDAAFDDLVQCVTASLWADLLQKPPGKSQ